MSKKTRQTSNDKNGVAKNEARLTWLFSHLFELNLIWLAGRLLKNLRLSWHGHPIKLEQGPKEGAFLPTGPFVKTRNQHIGDMLLWVPRRIDSYLIDALTGGYGYSHSTIDTGEIDVPTRKPVMVEITVGQTVMRKFQDEYGQRAFARVPISRTGVDVEKFMACVLSKMGEQYDKLDAITLGEIKDPAKEVCTGLAADCLPEKELQRIARAKRVGLLHKTSVSVHSKPGASQTRVFISPNGFAEYYGAPQGRKLNGLDTHVQPLPVKISMASVATAASRQHGWKLGAGLFAILLLVLILK